MLLIAENIQKSYGEKKLLDNVSLNIEEKEKIGIIGINGCGKSTLLKILAGRLEADSGEVNLIGKVKISYLPQDLEINQDNTILDEVLRNVTSDVEAKEHEAKAILTKLELFDFNKVISTLSGGEKRKVALACALINPCDILMLDEPTNHLDSDMIEWLEKYLIKFTKTIVMITHDRYFLERVVNKIVEVDKGKIYEYQANYSKFLDLKAEREESLLNQEKKIQTFLRKESEWIHRGARARATKEKKRVEKYEELTSREKVVEKKLVLESEKSRLGRKTIELINVSKGYENPLFKDFSINVDKDARIGFIGKNGSGKTSLFKIMAGVTSADTGEVIIGETVKLGYFSQNNEALDESKRAIDYIKSISEVVKTKNGTISASQMLENFLFSEPYIPISKLSGGEKRRLALLGVLMSAPNILLLDEPTNDLDITTLTLLENYLEEFVGAVLIISHDRYFLDKVVNKVYVLGNDYKWKQYNGGYSDYLEIKKDDVVLKTFKEIRTEKPKEKKIKLTFLEQKEFETIEEETEKISEKINEVQKEIDANITDYYKTKDLYLEKEKLEKELEEKFARWEYLSEIDRLSKK